MILILTKKLKSASLKSMEVAKFVFLLFSFHLVSGNHWARKCHQCKGVLGMCDDKDDLGESITCPEQSKGCLIYTDGRKYLT